MKITVLMENLPGEKGLAYEHGLSLYIEANGKKLLFDTGQGSGFADNAEKLGVDLSKTEAVIISHGHYDHAGGLMRFFEINPYAPVYINRFGFSNCYTKEGEYIGINPSLKNSKRIKPVDGNLKLGNGFSICSLPDSELVEPIDSAGLEIEEDGRRRPDSFLHEQYLLIEEGGRKMLISGCSHRGIVNIENKFRPSVLFGGFHFFKVADDDAGKRRLEAAAEKLLSFNTEYYTGHCTGERQYAFLKKIMGPRLHYLTLGSVIEV